ncbi:hypothetical protein NNJEOMEG_01590 [Fundidesulfovibrio magnetotacticus]|uniref:Uncharacterized protein n=1 Tax=Fundidesulfovibrio magnetotacticus TaxID=2730080 RepID=A0A6V8LVA9_9BACT|nr:hypothetical protein [Fundidesulfovibrio magnetotacticus]GFK93756.1 hypothetical protein NNJEOMEG_01590 [Fundidesulfovibrio magnetotacticus]
MFSDHLRWIKCALSALLLAGIVLAGADGPPGERSLARCLDQPSDCDGALLYINQAVVAAVGPEGFRLATRKGPVQVEGRWPEVETGSIVDLAAAFRPPNRLDPSLVHVHLDRAFKVWGSLAAAVVACGIFLQALARALRAKP